MLYVVLATFAAGMSTEYFLGNRWIGFFAKFNVFISR